MNKPGLIVLTLAVAAGAAYFLVRKQETGGGVYSAAHYLPAGTLAVVEVTDLPRSQTRFKETSLSKIANEPEVKAFLELPLSKLPKNEAFDKALANFRSSNPRQGFVAVTSLDGNEPKLVAGMAFHGPIEGFQLVLNDLRGKLKSNTPSGKADLVRHHEDEIESYSDPEKKVTVAGAFAGQWYFVANDVELLKSTLDRYRERVKDNTLAEAEIYTKSTKPLVADADARYFINPAVPIDKLIAFTTASGQPMQPAQEKQLRAMKGVAGTLRMEGPLFRDQHYFYSPEGMKSPALTGNIAKLAGQHAFFYLATSIPDNQELFEFPAVPADSPDPIGWVATYNSIRERLQTAGINATELAKAAGDEYSVVLDWPEGKQQPSAYGAFAIEDKSLALRVADIVFSNWQKEEGKDGAGPVWTWDTGSPIAHPAATLTADNLIIAQTPAALTELLAKSADTTNRLQTTPAFVSAKKTLEPLSDKPSQEFYLDSKLLFERVYDQLRLVAPLALAFSPDTANYVDLSKMPQTETIAKHLVPTFMVGGMTGDGYFYESSGTVTFYQGITGVAVTAGAVAAPFLQGKLPLPGIGGGAGAQQQPSGIPDGPWMQGPAGGQENP